MVQQQSILSFQYYNTNDFVAKPRKVSIIKQLIYYIHKICISILLRSNSLTSLAKHNVSSYHILKSISLLLGTLFSPIQHEHTPTLLTRLLHNFLLFFNFCTETSANLMSLLIAVYWAKTIRPIFCFHMSKTLVFKVIFFTLSIVFHFI